MPQYKWTHEDFVEKVMSLRDDVEILSQLIGSEKPILIKHKCGHVYTTTPYRVIRGVHCPFCRDRVELTHEEFMAKIEGKHDSVVIMNRYVNAKTPLLIKRSCCDKAMPVLPVTLLHGSLGTRCLDCRNALSSKTQIALRFTHDKFMEKMRDLGHLSPSFDIIGEFTEYTSPILIYCNKCCCSTTRIASRLIAAGFTCVCSKRRDGQLKRIKSQEVFVEEIRQLHSGTIEVLGQYTRNWAKILVRHECGYEWESDPSTLLRGCGCPACNTMWVSKGSNTIRRYLDTNNIDYRKEVNLEGCRDISLLPFDFVLYLVDITLAIEFDGEQHFSSYRIFGGDKGLEGVQRRDKIKNDYCKTHGIPLLRIRYDQVDQIPALIDAFILEHTCGDAMQEVAASQDMEVSG